MKCVFQNISRNKRGSLAFFAVFRGPWREHRAIEQTEGCRGDRGQLRRQRAVERTEGLGGDIG
jgi:hypothetical protein